MSIFIEDPLCLRYKRHRLITSLDIFSIEDSPMDFCSFQAESKPSPRMEYLWFLENECLICFQVTILLLTHNTIEELLLCAHLFSALPEFPIELRDTTLCLH